MRLKLRQVLDKKGFGTKAVQRLVNEYFLGIERIGMDRFEQVRKKILEFRDRRNWRQFHDPKNLAEGLAIESAELLENFLWKDTLEAKKLTAREVKAVKDECADIFVFLTYLSEEFGFDLLDEVKRKLVVNARKYPVRKAKGKREKYDKL